MVDQPVEKSVDKHRRETRRQIILPFAAALLVIIVCVIAVMSPLFPPPYGGYQVSIVSNILLMVFILCPSVICFGVLAFLMIVAAFAMNKGHDALAKPLRQLEDYSQALATKTVEITSAINQRTINTSSRFALLYKWLGVFERPKLSGREGDNKDESNFS